MRSTTLFLLVAYALPASSQVARLDSLLHHFARNYMPERVYVQYDKSIYQPGETVWFKAYFMSGGLPSNISKSFYMDWANDSGRVIAHKCYPIANASTHGQFIIPEDYGGNFLHLQAYTKWMLNFDSGLLYHKTIRIAQDKVSSGNALSGSGDSLYFFPEGGDMIAGLENKIAFKAVNSCRAPIAVSGYVLDSAMQVVDSFQSRHDGMGYFYLHSPLAERYTAIWKDENNHEHHSPLPLVKDEGINLRIEIEGNTRKFVIQRTDNAEEHLRRLHLVATQRQQLVFEADINLEDRIKVEASVPVSQLSSGILRFTLFDKDWLPVAERISFVNNGEYIFSPTINTDTISLGRRGLNVLSIDVPDSFQANLSIAITDADGGVDSSDNIISRLLLTSELKGVIYNPAYYFKDSSLRTQQDLDLVMLTNGWRRYDWKKILQGDFPVLKYPKDSAYLYFSGQLSGKIPGALKKIIMDTSTKHLLIFSLRPVHDTLSQFLPLSLDTAGHFGKPGLLVFDSLVVGYQFSDKRINLRTPKIDFMSGKIKEPIPMHIWPTMEFFNPENPQESTSHPVKRVPGNSIISAKGIRLKAVKVIAKAKTPAEILEERYTTDHSIFRGAWGYNVDVQDDKNAELALNILSYLQMKVPGLKITPSNDALTPPHMEWSGKRSYLPGVGFVPPAIYFNEAYVPPDLILRIPVSNIAYVKAFEPPFGSDRGGAIAVYTKGGKDYYNSLPSRIKEQIIIGYDVIKEFYSPDYKHDKNNNTIDLRTTLYWDPMVLSSIDNRRIKIHFYNNNGANGYRIIMEGLMKNGRIIHVDRSVISN